MVNEQNLFTILATLKDAGVTRAKFGDVEFEFTVERENEVSDYSQPRVLVSAPRDEDEPEQVRHPYAAVFNGQMPGFKPKTK